MKNQWIDLSWSRVTNSRVFLCVHSKITGGATSASKASFQRNAHKHHLSPGLRPLNLNLGRGVIKSLPRLRVKSKKSCVMRAQTTWLPWSWWSVLQQPSLKNPVNGSYEHGINSVPSTLRAGSLMSMILLACTLGTNAGLAFSCIWHLIHHSRSENCIHAPAAFGFGASCFGLFYGARIRFMANGAWC